MAMDLDDFLQLQSFEIAWIAIFFSALFVLYFSQTNFYYANIVILQLLLFFLVYKLNNNNYFNTFSVLVVIIIHILTITSNVNVFEQQSSISFFCKALLLLCVLFLSNKPNEIYRNISNISLIILIIWFLFDRNSVSFNYQS